MLPCFYILIWKENTLHRLKIDIIVIFKQRTWTYQVPHCFQTLSIRFSEIFSVSRSWPLESSVNGMGREDCLNRMYVYSKALIFIRQKVHAKISRLHVLFPSTTDKVKLIPTKISYSLFKISFSSSVFSFCFQGMYSIMKEGIHFHNTRIKFIVKSILQQNQPSLFSLSHSRILGIKLIIISFWLQH